MSNGTVALVTAGKQPVTKEERETITLIETTPREDWFEKAVDERGRILWFIRVQMTGLRTRRSGPFASKRKGLLFLDRLLNEIYDGRLEAENALEEYQIKPRQFSRLNGLYPIVEDELTAQQRGQQGTE